MAGLVLLGVLLVALYFGWCSWADRQGAKAWQATLDHLKAKDDPIDFHALVPPRIPDSDNLVALPLFDLERDPTDKILEPLKLNSALEAINRNGAGLPHGSWTRGKAVDPAEVDRYLGNCFRQVFPSRPVPTSPLARFDALCPAIGQLRQAAVERKDCRFDPTDASDPPWPRRFAGVVSMIQLSKFIHLNAITALQEKNPSLALEDINLDQQLDAGLRKEPFLVSGLVAIGVLSIELGAVWEGLESHAWNDAQLAVLQHELAEVDFLADYQLCLRGEALASFGPLMDLDRRHHERVDAILRDLIHGDMTNARTRIETALTPDGWWEETKAAGVEFDMDAAREPVDLRLRHVYPDKLAAIETRVNGYRSNSLGGILVHVAVPPVIASATHFAEAQFRVDATRIACMIERYRLAHGALPTSLDQLTPYADDGAGIPHDLCNGEPLHYSLRTDGTYLLYSVGWNQLDDGGQVVYRTDQPKAVDEKNGDWVWPQPGHPGT